MAAALALCGALSWGVGDFLGGLASRRIAVLTVLAVLFSTLWFGALAASRLDRA